MYIKKSAHNFQIRNYVSAMFSYFSLNLTNITQKYGKQKQSSWKTAFYFGFSFENYFITKLVMLGNEYIYMRSRNLNQKTRLTKTCL